MYKMKDFTFETEKQSNTVSEASGVYKSRRYTYADYLAWSSNLRCELIDGSVYALPSPPRRHADITINLASSIKWFVKRQRCGCKVYHAPFDVRLSPDGEKSDDKIYNVVQPDICIVHDLSKLDKRGCLGTPDMIVETLSPHTAMRDISEKFYLYEAAGVSEYWIIYPDVMSLKVFLLQGNGRYDEGKVYYNPEKVPVYILDGLKINLRELFEE
jgi:Uma2 family endonuclease